MVSLRCKMLVKEELTKLGLHYVILDLEPLKFLKIGSSCGQNLNPNLVTCLYMPDMSFYEKTGTFNLS